MRFLSFAISSLVCYNCIPCTVPVPCIATYLNVFSHLLNLDSQNN